MNKIILLPIITILVVVSVSCNSLLKEDPEYTLNGESLFSDETSAQLALNACYGYLASTGMYGRYLTGVTEIASGMAWSQKNSGTLNEFAALDILATNNFNNVFWTSVYQAIAETNAFIDNVEASSIDNKDYMAAQAKFIRGLCYYNLAFIYGGVPLRIGLTGKENLELPRSSQDEILDQVTLDLEEAAVSLNDTESDTSMPSKVSAYMLIAKVYFLLASSEGEASENWQKAKDYGDKVFEIAGSTVPLEPVFSTLFDENTTESVESLFKLNYSMEGTGSSFNMNSWMYSPFNSTLDGINYANNRLSKAFFNYFREQHPDDPRIDMSYFHTSYTNVKTGASVNCYPNVNKVANQYSWPFFKKHYDSRQNGQVGAKTFFVLRYADFLLMMADVENELGNTSVAVQYVNQILERARTSVTPEATEPKDIELTVSKEELRHIIFDERLFELNQEGHSFMETRRRGYDYFAEIIQRHNADTDTQAGFESTNQWSDYKLPETEDQITKAMLMPIPQTEIDTNSKISSEDQNPGY